MGSRAGVIALLILISGWMAPLVRAQSAGGNSPTFDVVSIKANHSGLRAATSRMNDVMGLAVQNGGVVGLIRSAYPAENREVLGVPDWAMTERFDIVARPGHEVSGDDLRQMIRAMLADRFKLQVHYETREQSVYRLVVARSDRRLGDEMRTSTLDCDAVTAANRRGERLNVTASNGAPPCGSRYSNGLFESGGIELRQFALMLSNYADRVVLDDTRLPGRWEFTLRFTAQPSVTASSTDDPPSLFTALPEQLGLKLEPSRAPLQTLVVDHLERPTEN